MYLFKRSTALAACVWGAVAPLQAVPSPQEIFTRLSAPEPPPVQRPELRAERLPSLELLPAEADMVLAAVEPGKLALELMRLLGRAPEPRLATALNSIRDGALLAGEGSAEALAEALPLLTQASQLEALRKVEDWWCERARPECVEVIRSAFRHQRTLARQNIMEALDGFHPAPVYCVITAAAGREEDFAAMQREVEEGMRRAGEADDSLQYEEMDGFSGLRMTWLHLYRWLMGSEPQDAELSRGLAQRELHLLTRAQQGVSGFFLCARPSEIQLPQSPEASMLYSSKWSDSHLSHLMMAGWMSTGLNRAMRFCLQSDRRPVAQAVADVLLRMGGQEATQEPVFNKAASCVMWFVGQPPYFDEINTPMEMQVWRQGDAVYVESISDAQGMEFGQGALRLVAQAAAPEMCFYLESTSFSAPYTPVFERYWNKCLASALGAARGVALTLREEHRSQAEAWLRYAGLMLPEMQALGAALHTVASGMAAPFALVATRPEGQGCAGVAFGSAVKNRSALAQGWQEVLAAVGAAAGKLGMPAELVSALPIASHRLANGAVSYAPVLPGAAGNPGAAVSDAYVVLGNSAALNERLIAEATGNMPFCGAVSCVDFPGLVAALGEQSWSCCGQRVTVLLKRLSEKFKRFYSVSTISGGQRYARGMME